MLLQLIPKSVTQYTCEVYDNEGGLLQQRILNRYNERDTRWLSTVSQWPLVETNQNIQRLCENDEKSPECFDFEPPAELAESWNQKPNPAEVETPPEPFVLHMREITQLKRHGKTYRNEDPATTLSEAFADVYAPWKEPIIEWVDLDRLCCLDVDYHNTTPPDADTLASLVASVRPQPFAWHPSHGGGAKLYYVEHPGYTAVELASVAGMQWVEAQPQATFDLIKSTRHPFYFRSRDGKPPPCYAINYVHGSGDVSSLRRLINSEVEDNDIEEWLAARGWNMGQTLPHSQCLIEPDDSHKECVFVGDRGIYCHKCAARGLGGRSPGLTTYGSLIRGADGRVKNMVNHFVHLEHARIVLQNIYPFIPQKVLDNIYRVMLKIVHGDDPRVKMAMVAGRGFIRTRGQWASADGEVSITDGLVGYVRSLPVTLFAKKDEFGVNIPCFTSLINSGDVSEYGYPDVSFIRGCKIYGQFLPYPHGEVVKVITRREFHKTAPQYIPPARRMPVEHAWRLLEDEFPGINRTYLELLIAAKGASEGRLAQCPFLMITGVSSAGKSTTVHIAAGICGDKADEPIFYPDVMRFRGSLMDAARTSGFICVNEVFKMAERAKLSPTQALDPMLSLTEDSRSHVLYVGSVPFGRLPVFVLTDINCPAEIIQDFQLARRFTFYRLDSSIEWTNTLVERNIRPHEFRLISDQHTDAADSILSTIIDNHFQHPTPLAVIANRLGIHTAGVDSIKPVVPTDPTDPTQPVDNTVEPESDYIDPRADTKELLLRFYHAVVKAPPITGSDAVRYKAIYGWKKIDRAHNSDILDIWSELCDGPSGPQWCQSRTCAAEDWRKLLHTELPVVLDISPYQQRILYVRFRSTDSPRKPSWVNGQKL